MAKSLLSELRTRGVISNEPTRRDEVTVTTTRQRSPLERAASFFSAPLDFGVGVLQSAVDAPRAFADLGSKVGSAAANTRFGRAFGGALAQIAGLDTSNTKGLSKLQTGLKQGTEQTALTEARGTAGQAGQVVGDIAQAVFLPGPGSAKLAGRAGQLASKAGLGQKATSLARGTARIAGDVAQDVVLTGAQTQDAGAAATAGALTGGFGVLGATVPLITRVLPRITNRVLKAGQGNKVVQEIAEKYGIQLPASAVTDSKLVEVAEQAAAKGAFGGRFYKLVDDGLEKLSKIGDEVLTSVGGAKSAEEAGGRVLEGITKLQDDFIKTKTDLYNRIPDKGANGLEGVLISADDTVAFLEDVVDRLARRADIVDTPELSFYQKLLNGLTETADEVRRPKEITALQLREVLKGVGLATKFDSGIKTGDAATIQKLYASLSDTLDNALEVSRPDLGTALKEANEFYAETVGILQGRLIKNLQNLTDRPDKVFEIITRPTTSVEDIRQIVKLAGDNKADLQAAFINEALKKSTDVGGDLKATALQRLMKAFGPEKLEAVLDSNQIQVLSDMAELSTAIAKGKKIAEGSQTAFTGRVMAELFGFFVNPIIAIKLIAADAALSKFIFSDKGQQFLLNGIDENSIELVGDLLQGISRPVGRGVGAAAGQATSTPPDQAQIE
jgi:hypothetical protein